MEVELKLLLMPADAAAFRRLAMLPQWAVGKPHLQKFSTTYFDTPALRLKEHGMELRVRRAGRLWTETLKAGGRAIAGLPQRQEWEASIDGPRPNLAALAALVQRGSNWEKVLTAPALAQGMGPIFDSVFRRTVWSFRLPHGTLVDVALDQGELRRGHAHEPISEIKLMLKAGDPAALFDFALQLQNKVRLRVANLGKAARGYALVAPQPSTGVKAGAVELALEMTVDQGFRAIVSNCAAQMQDNESGVVRTNDPESVHQMRVGLRRLRSALGLFAKWAPLPVVLQSELEWLAGQLGAARDADVLADTTLARMADACPTEAELPPLKQAASMIARAKRQHAAGSVASVRYSRMMLGLVAWLHSSRWRESPDDSARQALAEPLDKRAAEILARRHKKLLESGKRLEHGTPEDRHRVRIAAKKARYAAEFFQRLRPARRAKRYIKRLTTLQDAIGSLNDATVADGLLRQVEKSHPGLADSTAFARGFLCCRTNQEVRELAELWEQCSAMKPP
jgi:inorganic triphosphatase YgiF